VAYSDSLNCPGSGFSHCPGKVTDKEVQKKWTREDTFVLKLNDLTIKFGGLVAVNDFSLEIEKGELVGLIGPNGAGKTQYLT